MPVDCATHIPKCAPQSCLKPRRTFAKLEPFNNTSPLAAVSPTAGSELRTLEKESMRDSRRTLVFGCLLATVTTVSGFAVGALHARGASAAETETAPSHDSANAKIVAEVKAQIAREMGLVPLSVMRERRASFVELYAYDALGKTHYGTAGYLGHGYFVTVKHAVVGLKGDGSAPAPAIDAVKVVYKGEEIPAKVVDMGDANVEVHRGDWAIIHTRDLDLPAVRVDTAFT